MEYISIDSKDRTTDNNVEFSEDINLNQMSINNDVITIHHNNDYQDGDNININFPTLEFKELNNPFIYKKPDLSSLVSTYYSNNSIHNNTFTINNNICNNLFSLSFSINITNTKVTKQLLNIDNKITFDYNDKLSIKHLNTQSFDTHNDIFNENTWYHLTYTFNGTHGFLYINGFKLLKVDIDSGTINTSSNIVFNIEGTLKNIKLFDKSLTDIEVESINELTYIYTHYPNYPFKENSFAIIKDFQFGQGTADYTISNTNIILTNITVENFENTNIFQLNDKLHLIIDSDFVPDNEEFTITQVTSNSITLDLKTYTVSQNGSCSWKVVNDYDFHASNVMDVNTYMNQLAPPKIRQVSEFEHNQLSLQGSNTDWFKFELPLSHGNVSDVKKFSVRNSSMNYRWGGNVKIGIDTDIVHLFTPKVVSGRINQFPISTNKDNVNIQHYGQYINQEKVFLDHQSTVDLYNVKPLEGLADVNTVENKTHLKFITKNVNNFELKNLLNQYISFDNYTDTTINFIDNTSIDLANESFKVVYVNKFNEIIIDLRNVVETSTFDNDLKWSIIYNDVLYKSVIRSPSVITKEYSKLLVNLEDYDNDLAYHVNTFNSFRFMKIEFGERTLNTTGLRMYYKITNGNLSLDDQVTFKLKGDSFIEFTDGLRIESSDDIEEDNILGDVLNSLTPDSLLTDNENLITNYNSTNVTFQIFNTLFVDLNNSTQTTTKFTETNQYLGLNLNNITVEANKKYKIKITGTSSHSNAYLIIKNYDLNNSKSFYDYSGDFDGNSNPLLSSETTVTKKFTSLYTSLDISLKIYYDQTNTQNLVISNIELIPITLNNTVNNVSFPIYYLDNIYQKTQNKYNLNNKFANEEFNVNYTFNELSNKYTDYDGTIVINTQRKINSYQLDSSYNVNGYYEIEFKTITDDIPTFGKMIFLDSVNNEIEFDTSNANSSVTPLIGDNIDIKINLPNANSIRYTDGSYESSNSVNGKIVYYSDDYMIVDLEKELSEYNSTWRNTYFNKTQFEQLKLLTPTTITINNNIILKTLSNTLVGYLNSNDSSDVYTFALETYNQDFVNNVYDNNLFQIQNNNELHFIGNVNDLKEIVNSVSYFKSKLNIRLRVLNKYNLAYSDTLTLYIQDKPPNRIQLTTNEITDHYFGEIANISVYDEDNNQLSNLDIKVYSDEISIKNNTLYLNTLSNFEVKSKYTVFVKVIDKYNNILNKNLYFYVKEDIPPQDIQMYNTITVTNHTDIYYQTTSTSSDELTFLNANWRYGRQDYHDLESDINLAEYLLIKKSTLFDEFKLFEDRDFWNNLVLSFRSKKFTFDGSEPLVYNLYRDDNKLTDITYRPTGIYYNMHNLRDFNTLTSDVKLFFNSIENNVSSQINEVLSNVYNTSVSIIDSSSNHNITFGTENNIVITKNNTERLMNFDILSKINTTTLSNYTYQTTNTQIKFIEILNQYYKCLERFYFNVYNDSTYKFSTDSFPVYQNNKHKVWIKDIKNSIDKSFYDVTIYKFEDNEFTSYSLNNPTVEKSISLNVGDQLYLNHKLVEVSSINGNKFNTNWLLVTELNIDDPVNNPWNGTKKSGAPDVLIPLNTLSSSNGTDLEIKIEWDNNNGTTSSRFYKNWRLDYVFDYTLGNSGNVYKPSSDITVSAKWNENDDWYSRNQKIRHANNKWEWCFCESNGSTRTYQQSMSGDIGYKNVGFLLHGYNNSDEAGRIYSGRDENSTGIYNAYRSWSKVRVYVKNAPVYVNNVFPTFGFYFKLTNFENLPEDRKIKIDYSTDTTTPLATIKLVNNYNENKEKLIKQCKTEQIINKDDSIEPSNTNINTTFTNDNELNIRTHKLYYYPFKFDHPPLHTNWIIRNLSGTQGTYFRVSHFDLANNYIVVDTDSYNNGSYSSTGWSGRYFANGTYNDRIQYIHETNNHTIRYEITGNWGPTNLMGDEGWSMIASQAHHRCGVVDTSPREDYVLLHVNKNNTEDSYQYLDENTYVNYNFENLFGKNFRELKSNKDGGELMDVLSNNSLISLSNNIYVKNQNIKVDEFDGSDYTQSYNFNVSTTSNESVVILDYYKFTSTSHSSYRALSPTLNNSALSNVDVSSMIDPNTNKFYDNVRLSLDIKSNNVNHKINRFEYTRINNQQGWAYNLSGFLNNWTANKWYTIEIYPTELGGYNNHNSTDWTNMNRLEIYTVNKSSSGELELRNVRFERVNQENNLVFKGLNNTNLLSEKTPLINYLKTIKDQSFDEIKTSYGLDLSNTERAYNGRLNTYIENKNAIFKIGISEVDYYKLDMMKNVFSTKNLEITNSYLRGYILENLEFKTVKLQKNGTLSDLTRDTSDSTVGDYSSRDTSYLPYRYNLTNPYPVVTTNIFDSGKDLHSDILISKFSDDSNYYPFTARVYKRVRVSNLDYYHYNYIRIRYSYSSSCGSGSGTTIYSQTENLLVDSIDYVNKQTVFTESPYTVKYYRFLELLMSDESNYELEIKLDNKWYKLKFIFTQKRRQSKQFMWPYMWIRGPYINDELNDESFNFLNSKMNEYSGCYDFRIKLRDTHNILKFKIENQSIDSTGIMRDNTSFINELNNNNTIKVFNGKIFSECPMSVDSNNNISITNLLTDLTYTASVKASSQWPITIENPNNFRSYQSSSLFAGEKIGSISANNSVKNILSYSEWILSAKLYRDDKINNPWNGTKSSDAPNVLVPLNTLSSSNGTDLEIKIEWKHDNGKISSRFYKGWRLDYVFDYTLGNSSDSYTPSSDITVYAKWNENDNWYSRSQKIRHANNKWEWCFTEGTGTELDHTQTMSGDIGYKNVGFILHGYNNSDEAGRIYSGQDENSTGIYSGFRDWIYVSVYVKRNDNYPFIYKNITQKYFYLNTLHGYSTGNNIYSTYKKDKNVIKYNPSNNITTYKIDINTNRNTNFSLYKNLLNLSNLKRLDDTNIINDNNPRLPNISDSRFLNDVPPQEFGTNEHIRFYYNNGDNSVDPPIQPSLSILTRLYKKNLYKNDMIKFDFIYKYFAREERYLSILGISFSYNVYWDLKVKIEYVFTVDEDFIVPEDDPYDQFYMVKVNLYNIGRVITYLKDDSNWDWSRSNRPFFNSLYGFQHYYDFFQYDEGGGVVPFAELFTDNNTDDLKEYGLISIFDHYNYDYNGNTSVPKQLSMNIIFIKKDNTLKLNREININLQSNSIINIIDNYGYILESSTLMFDYLYPTDTISLTDTIDYNVYINNASNVSLYSIPNIQFIYDLYITDDFDGDINIFIYQIYDNVSYDISNSSSVSVIKYFDGSISKNKLSGNFYFSYNLGKYYKLSIRDSNNKILSILTLDDYYSNGSHTELVVVEDIDSRLFGANTNNKLFIENKSILVSEKINIKDIDYLNRWQTKSLTFTPGIKGFSFNCEVSLHNNGNCYIGSFRIKELDSINKINFESIEYEIDSSTGNILSLPSDPETIVDKIETSETTNYDDYWELTTEIDIDSSICNPWNGDIKEYLIFELSSGFLDFDFYTTFYARKIKIEIIDGPTTSGNTNGPGLVSDVKINGVLDEGYERYVSSFNTYTYTVNLMFGSYQSVRLQKDTKLSDKNSWNQSEAWKIKNNDNLPQSLVINLVPDENSDLAEFTGIRIDKSDDGIYANKVKIYYSESLDDTVWIPIYQYKPPNLIKPLNLFSNNYGTDLEIKIEWDNNNGTTSSRFYKGWRLDYVFDYTLGNNGDIYKPSSDITVYAKWEEDDDWYSTNQKIRHSNENWEWCFCESDGSTKTYQQLMSGDIGYKNVGFLLHGYNDSDIAGSIYSGQDENSTGIYNGYRSWSKLRVYVKRSSYTLPKSMHCYNDMKKDLIHSIYFSSDGYHDQLGNATVTLVNNPTVNSNGLNCNGTGYATLNTLDLGKTMTIAVWFRINNFSSYQKIFDFSNGAAPNNNIYIEQNGNNNQLKAVHLYGSSYSNNTSVTSSNSSKLLRQFTLGILRIEDTGTKIYYTLYIKNSTYYSKINNTYNGTASNIIRNFNSIGASSSGTKIFNGYIKSINIWRRILSDDEVNNIYIRYYYNNIYTQTIPNINSYVKGIIPNEPDNIREFDVIMKLKIRPNEIYNSTLIPLMSFSSLKSGNIWLVRDSQQSNFGLGSLGSFQTVDFDSEARNKILMDHEVIIRIVFTDTILKYMFIDVDDNDYNISDIENINSSSDINLLSNSSYKGYYEYEYINDNINFTDYVGILGHLRDYNNNIIFYMFNYGERDCIYNYFNYSNNTYFPSYVLYSNNYVTTHCGFDLHELKIRKNTNNYYIPLIHYGMKNYLLSNCNLIQNKSYMFIEEYLDNTKTFQLPNNNNTNIINNFDINDFNINDTFIITNSSYPIFNNKKIRLISKGSTFDISNKMTFEKIGDDWIEYVSSYYGNIYYSSSATFNIKKSSFTSQLLFNNQYLYEGTEKNIYGDIPNLIFSDLYNISIKRLTNPNRIIIKYNTSSTLSPPSDIIQSFNQNYYSIEGLYKIVDSNTDYDNKLLKLYNYDFNTDNISFEIKIYSSTSISTINGYRDTTFDTPILADKIRLNVLEWNSFISLRYDVYTSDTIDGTYELNNTPEINRYYSSVWANDDKGTGHARSMIDSSQAWSAEVSNTEQWTELHLGKLKYINGIKIQPRGGSSYTNQYIKKFNLFAIRSPYINLEYEFNDPNDYNLVTAEYSNDNADNLPNIHQGKIKGVFTYYNAFKLESSSIQDSNEYSDPNDSNNLEVVNSNDISNQEYVKVTLEKESNISKIVITNRPEVYSYQLSGASIYLYNDNLELVYEKMIYSSIYNLIPMTFNIKGTVDARYLMIKGRRGKQVGLSKIRIYGGVNLDNLLFDKDFLNIKLKITDTSSPYKSIKIPVNLQTTEIVDKFKNNPKYGNRFIYKLPNTRTISYSYRSNFGIRYDTASENFPTLTDNSNNNITDVPYYKYLFVKFKIIKKEILLENDGSKNEYYIFSNYYNYDENDKILTYIRNRLDNMALVYKLYSSSYYKLTGITESTVNINLFGHLASSEIYNNDYYGDPNKDDFHYLYLNNNDIVFDIENSRDLNNFTDASSFDKLKDNKLFYLQIINNDYIKINDTTNNTFKSDIITYNNNYTQCLFLDLIDFNISYIQNFNLLIYSSCILTYKLLDYALDKFGNTITQSSTYYSTVLDNRQPTITSSNNKSILTYNSNLNINQKLLNENFIYYLKLNDVFILQDGSTDKLTLIINQLSLNTNNYIVQFITNQNINLNNEEYEIVTNSNSLPELAINEDYLLTNDQVYQRTVGDTNNEFLEIVFPESKYISYIVIYPTYTNNDLWLNNATLTFYDNSDNIISLSNELGESINNQLVIESSTSLLSNIVFEISEILCKKVILQQTNKYPVSVVEISFYNYRFHNGLEEKNYFQNETFELKIQKYDNSSDFAFEQSGSNYIDINNNNIDFLLNSIITHNIDIFVNNKTLSINNTNPYSITDLTLFNNTYKFRNNSILINNNYLNYYYNDKNLNLSITLNHTYTNNPSDNYSWYIETYYEKFNNNYVKSYYLVLTHKNVTNETDTYNLKYLIKSDDTVINPVFVNKFTTEFSDYYPIIETGTQFTNTLNIKMITDNVDQATDNAITLSPDRNHNFIYMKASDFYTNVPKTFYKLRLNDNSYINIAILPLENKINTYYKPFDITTSNKYGLDIPVSIDSTLHNPDSINSNNTNYLKSINIIADTTDVLLQNNTLINITNSNLSKNTQNTNFIDANNLYLINNLTQKTIEFNNVNIANIGSNTFNNYSTYTNINTPSNTNHYSGYSYFSTTVNIDDDLLALNNTVKIYTGTTLSYTLNINYIHVDNTTYYIVLNKQITAGSYNVKIVFQNVKANTKYLNNYTKQNLYEQINNHYNYPSTDLTNKYVDIHGGLRTKMQICYNFNNHIIGKIAELFIETNSDLQSIFSNSNIQYDILNVFYKTNKTNNNKLNLINSSNPMGFSITNNELHKDSALFFNDGTDDIHCYYVEIACTLKDNTDVSGLSNIYSDVKNYKGKVFKVYTLTIPNTFPTIFLNNNQIIENVKGQEISLIKILPDVIPNCEIEIVNNPNNIFELYSEEYNTLTSQYPDIKLNEENIGNRINYQTNSTILKLKNDQACTVGNYNITLRLHFDHGRTFDNDFTLSCIQDNIPIELEVVGNYYKYFEMRNVGDDWKLFKKNVKFDSNVIYKINNTIGVQIAAKFGNTNSSLTGKYIHTGFVPVYFLDDNRKAKHFIIDTELPKDNFNTNEHILDISIQDDYLPELPITIDNTNELVSNLQIYDSFKLKAKNQFTISNYQTFNLPNSINTIANSNVITINHTNHNYSDNDTILLTGDLDISGHYNIFSVLSDSYKVTTTKTFDKTLSNQGGIYISVQKQYPLVLSDSSSIHKLTETVYLSIKENNSINIINYNNTTKFIYIQQPGYTTYGSEEQIRKRKNSQYLIKDGVYDSNTNSVQQDIASGIKTKYIGQLLVTNHSGGTFVLNNHNDKFEIVGDVLKIKNTTLDYNEQNIYNLSITNGSITNDIILMVYQELDNITPMTYEFTGPDKVIYKGDVHSTEGIEPAQSVGNSKLFSNMIDNTDFVKLNTDIVFSDNTTLNPNNNYPITNINHNDDTLIVNLTKNIKSTKKFEGINEINQYHISNIKAKWSVHNQNLNKSYNIQSNNDKSLILQNKSDKIIKSFGGAFAWIKYNDIAGIPQSEFNNHRIINRNNNSFDLKLDTNALVNTTVNKQFNIKKIISSQMIYNSSSQYRYYLDKPLEDILSVKLVGSSFPNTYFIVNNNHNNLAWEYNNITHNITLTNGYYNSDSLQNEIINKMKEFNQAEIIINANKQLFSIKLYDEVVLNNPFSVQQNSKLLTINHRKHGLQTGDKILISNSSDIGIIPLESINRLHTVTVLTNDIYTVKLLNLSNDTLNNQGGTEITIRTYLKFKLLNTQNNITKILGVSNINEELTTEFKNIENHINLFGYNYILLKIKSNQEFGEMNTHNINNVVAKIYFDLYGGQTVYNTFVTQEKIFEDKQKIEFLDISIYDEDGNLFDFAGLEHSFTLEFRKS